MRGRWPIESPPKQQRQLLIKSIRNCRGRIPVICDWP